MKFIRLKIFLLVLGFALVFLTQFYPVPDLMFQDFRIGNSSYAIGIENIYMQGMYYTISPFDDIIIYADGSEQKIGATDMMSKPGLGENNLLVNTLKRLQTDYDILVNHRQKMQFAKAVTLVGSYFVQVNTNSIDIIRKLDNESKQIIGIGQSMIFPSDTNILINDQPLAELSNATDTYITTNVNKITLISPFTTQFLVIRPNLTDQVIISKEYRVLTVKQFFAQTDLPEITNTQRIYLTSKY